MNDSPPNQVGHEDPGQEPEGAPRITPEATSSGVVLDPQGKPYPKTEHSDNPTRTAIRKIHKRLRDAKRMNVILTAIIAFSAVAQAFISCNSSRQTGSQVNRLIDVAGEIQQAAHNFSQSANGINLGIQQATTQLQNQAANLESARKSGQASANRALKANIDQFRQDQRPWLGWSNIAIDSTASSIEDCLAGRTCVTYRNISIRFVNTGKTPARVVSWNSHFWLGFQPSKESFENLVRGNTPSLAAPPSSVYPPGQYQTVNIVKNSNINISGTRNAVAFAVEIGYTDPWTSTIHKTKVCFFTDSASAGTFQYCPVPGSTDME